MMQATIVDIAISRRKKRGKFIQSETDTAELSVSVSTVQWHNIKTVKRAKTKKKD